MGTHKTSPSLRSNAKKLKILAERDFLQIHFPYFYKDPMHYYVLRVNICIFASYACNKTKMVVGPSRASRGQSGLENSLKVEASIIVRYRIERKLLSFINGNR
jgi:hypothetical protein